MKKNLSLFIALVLPAFCAVACGDSNAGQPASIATSDEQVQNMVKAREIYNASDKNWANLPADKKAEYTKLVGAKDDAGAQKWWSTMATPMGGGGNSSSGGQ